MTCATSCQRQDNAGGERLYEIAMGSNARIWDELPATFFRRHGKPASSERGRLTGYRGQLDNQTVTQPDRDLDKRREPDQTGRALRGSATDADRVTAQFADTQAGNAQLSSSLKVPKAPAERY